MKVSFIDLWLQEIFTIKNYGATEAEIYEQLMTNINWLI